MKNAVSVDQIPPPDQLWTAQSLETLVASKLQGRKFIVVSNRQPVTHSRRRGEIEESRGIGGVITALEPVILTCNGTWVALSDGDADRLVCDEEGRVSIRADGRRYWIRRVWVEKEDLEGYYYGYANGVLWPLCHMCFKRPRFIHSEWEAYRRVNEKFADAVIREAGDSRAFVWIQDYHLALVAGILKTRRPGQFMTAHFWHIPWPGYETFRICPQKKEILSGMLANDLLGFHIRYHAQNFLDTVDREMVCKIDKENDSVLTNDSETLVRAYPISIDYERTLQSANEQEVERHCRHLLDEFEVRGKKVMIGLDRIDYTKGLPEKILAIDRMLDFHPELKEKFMFIQIGVISRLHLDAYKELNEEINVLVERINWKHATGIWRPITFIRRQLGFEELLALYRLADVGIVSSLHDGMNLVAKEFVTASVSDKSVLVLSQFAGAAKELTDALPINPYDQEGFARTLYEALIMPPHEKERKNQRMKSIIATHNVYFWAGKTLTDLFHISE